MTSLRARAVGLEVGRDEHRVGAQPPRPLGGRGGEDAVAARLVARGGDDGPRPAAGHHDRQPVSSGRRWSSTLDIEGVHVDVGDDASAPTRSTWSPAWTGRHQNLVDVHVRAAGPTREHHRRARVRWLGVRSGGAPRGLQVDRKIGRASQEHGTAHRHGSAGLATGRRLVPDRASRLTARQCLSEARDGPRVASACTSGRAHSDEFADAGSRSRPESSLGSSAAVPVVAADGVAGGRSHRIRAALVARSHAAADHRRERSVRASAVAAAQSQPDSGR